MRRSGIVVVLFIIAWIVNAAAQELNCVVTVSTENVPSGQRDYLRDFKADVEKYLNNNKWTDEDLGGEKIDCSMSIFFLAAVGENRYTAQVVVGSQRPVYVGNDKSGKNSQVLRIADDKWEFGYVPNQQMIKDEFRFDPLTDLLDFYAYLIIGLDLETYNELSGSRYLQKALSICNQANATSYGKDWQSSAGTYSKFGLIDELMNMKYQQFRLAFYSYHFEGIDLLDTEQQKGLDNILKALESIAELRQKQNPRSILVRTFFDSKYHEIADVFLTWPDRGVYDRLITADPAHQGTYDGYRRR
jgi:hypothetical protein